MPKGLAAILALAASVAAMIVLTIAFGLDSATGLITAVAAILTTILVLAQIDRVMSRGWAVRDAQRQEGPARTLRDHADELADRVYQQWNAEFESHRAHDPYPLPVTWQVAGESLQDQWANILGLPTGTATDPADLSGGIEEIAATYERVPSGRMVVLGAGGSGNDGLQPTQHEVV